MYLLRPLSTSKPNETSEGYFKCQSTNENNPLARILRSRRLEVGLRCPWLPNRTLELLRTDSSPMAPVHHGFRGLALNMWYSLRMILSKISQMMRPWTHLIYPNLLGRLKHRNLQKHLVVVLSTEMSFPSVWQSWRIVEDAFPPYLLPLTNLRHRPLVKALFRT
jgi:hypothetical protein